MKFVVKNGLPFLEFEFGFLLSGDTVDVLAYTQLRFTFSIILAISAQNQR